MLVSSLLLLLVVTIVALSMFRSFGIQEKIAGNMREKQRALQAAVTAQQFAEVWLANNGGNPSSAVACSYLARWHYRPGADLLHSAAKRDPCFHQPSTLAGRHCARRSDF